jgi:predicted MFS family arabinose efflux permease
MAGGSVAPTYEWLLLTRVALGAAVAAAGPVVSSLVGDSFSPPERGRVLGWVLAGEIAGAGAGLLIGAVVGALISWRAGFAALALLSALVSLLVLRQLPEPPRGGAYRSRRWSWWRAVRSVLAIPSVRRLILASAMGYFFFAGLRTFSVLLATHRYGLATTNIVLAAVLIGASALLGAVLGGRLADAWARRSDPGARLYVVAGGTMMAIGLFAPGLLTGSRGLALLLFILGTAGLGAANPALDAARLEVIPAALWGRAESVRSVLRLGAEATGPVVFGLVADALATRGNQASALRDTFLIMLAPLALSAAIVLLTRRRFPGDVAAASSH